MNGNTYLMLSEQDVVRVRNPNKDKIYDLLVAKIGIDQQGNKVIELLPMIHEVGTTIEIIKKSEYLDR